MIECDWCGKLEDDGKIHTYKKERKIYKTVVYNDILYICEDCYKKSIEKGEKIKWEKLKKEQQKSEG